MKAAIFAGLSLALVAVASAAALPVSEKKVIQETDSPVQRSDASSESSRRIGDAARSMRTDGGQYIGNYYFTMPPLPSFNGFNSDWAKSANPAPKLPAAYTYATSWAKADGPHAWTKVITKTYKSVDNTPGHQSAYSGSDTVAVAHA